MNEKRIEEIVCLLNAWEVPKELDQALRDEADCKVAFRVLLTLFGMPTGKGSAWARYCDGEFKGVRKVR